LRGQKRFNPLHHLRQKRGDHKFFGGQNIANEGKDLFLIACFFEFDIEGDLALDM
jgi:hypothetical protein